MRWCCSGSSSASASSSSNDEADDDNDEEAEEATGMTALANGGKQTRKREERGGGAKRKGGKQRKKKKGARMPLRVLGGGGGGTKGSAENSLRQPPEGILKGTHSRASGPRPPRAVQYADGTSEAVDGGSPAGEHRAMLMDSPASCSSPSPPSSPRPHRSSISIDQYGPMLLRQCKRALLVLSSSHSHSHSSSSSNYFPPPECPFIAALRQAEWEVQACTCNVVADEIRQRRPVVVLFDGTAKSKDELPALLRSVREASDSNGEEDILYAVLLNKVPNERRMRQMAKHRIQQFFLRSSTDIAFCEQFSRLCSRLRAVPALFTVVEEAQQPIKICDERNIVQYVNRAYELLTGRSRAMVLGSDGATEPIGRNQRSLNNVAAAAIAASATAAATAAVTWVAGTPPPTITMGTSVGNNGETKTDQQQQQQNTVIGNRLSVDKTAGTTQQQQPQQPPQQLQHQQSVPDNFVIPPNSPGTTTTSLVNRRRSSDWQCIAVPTCSNSQQYVYVKRGSADAAFFRESIQKGRSPSALVDAPINEALNALGNIVHRCDDETQVQLREAMRILSSSELYTPTITRFRENDRIASGYYDGLIRLHHPNRQRKRSVVDAFKDHQQRRVSGGSTVSALIGADAKGGDAEADSGVQCRRRVSTEIMSVLEREAFWDFDVIQLERVTEHHPLASLGAKVFERWSVCDALQCPPDVLTKWLTIIEANYQAGNAYHNATHAADVLQATSYFLNSDPVGQMIQDQHASAALIAATVHDLDHPGRGNAFLMNIRQRLALLYNDQSILENHHVALAFQLTLSQPGVNIFAKMPREEFTQMRQAVIDMVLATDMSRHFEHLAKFQQLMAIMPSDNADEDRDANSLIICRMMVKCADIANPTREWRLCHQWAMRIVEEYFDQTAEEMERKLPVTMKGFDRETCNVPLTQCTFMDMFARETFILWCEFAELPHLLAQLEENYAAWKAQSVDWDPKNNSNLLSRQR